MRYFWRFYAHYYIQIEIDDSGIFQVVVRHESVHKYISMLTLSFSFLQIIGSKRCVFRHQKRPTSTRDSVCRVVSGRLKSDVSQTFIISNYPSFVRALPIPDLLHRLWPFINTRLLLAQKSSPLCMPCSQSPLFVFSVLDMFLFSPQPSGRNINAEGSTHWVTQSWNLETNTVVVGQSQDLNLD